MKSETKIVDRLGQCVEQIEAICKRTPEGELATEEDQVKASFLLGEIKAIAFVLDQETELQPLIDAFKVEGTKRKLQAMVN